MKPNTGTPTKKINSIPIDEAWNVWKDCLFGRDINSIVHQIILLVWDAGIYRMLLESRQILVDQDPLHPKINNSLHRFIDHSFFHTQASSIRRLTDNSNGLYGKKGVYSLLSLVKDIKSRNNELTRKRYFELNNVPYDIDLIKKKQREFIQEKSHNDVDIYITPKEICSTISIEAHERFDHLSQVDPRNRQPNDIVPLSFWDAKIKEIQCSEAINKYVDKFVAHAASPESRSLSYDEAKITIIQIWDIHKKLCEVIDFLSNFIVGTHLMFLPNEPADFFDYWDSPIINSENTDLLRETFQNYRKDTEGWRFLKNS